jgi:hypothetical protein
MQSHGKVTLTFPPQGVTWRFDAPLGRSIRLDKSQRTQVVS